MRDIIFDCTELCSNPIRTGIQRVVREMLRHWPRSGPTLHLARFDGSTLIGLPERASRLLRDEDPETAELPYDTLAQQVHEAATYPSPNLPAHAPVLIPEVFFETKRSRFHVARAGAGVPLAMLAYDFLPFLQPGLFQLRSAAPLMGYVRAIRAATSVAHISAHTAHDYVHRVMHGDDRACGPVLPLGADGLALERQHWRPDRRAYVVLGSLDGRKNQDLITAAFIQLWRAGHPIPLVLIGSLFQHLDRGWLNEAQQFPHFRWLDGASAGDIARELRVARATLYVSTAEGFGLPPVESLAAGIPVIASAQLPSLAVAPAAGQIRLPEVTPEAIAQTVLALEEDDAAARLWQEAAALRLGTWHEFGSRSAEWAAEVLGSSRAA